jgi:hypothetical protein
VLVQHQKKDLFIMQKRKENTFYNGKTKKHILQWENMVFPTWFSKEVHKIAINCCQFCYCDCNRNIRVAMGMSTNWLVSLHEMTRWNQQRPQDSIVAWVYPCKGHIGCKINKAGLTRQSHYDCWNKSHQNTKTITKPWRYIIPRHLLKYPTTLPWKIRMQCVWWILSFPMQQNVF